MTGKLRILDRTGHTTIRWSTDLQETVDAANQRFNELIAQGYTAFVMTDTAHGEMTTTFDPQAETTLVIPRMVGG
jgi:hypothetical protein